MGDKKTTLLVFLFVGVVLFFIDRSYVNLHYNEKKIVIYIETLIFIRKTHISFIYLCRFGIVYQFYLSILKTHIGSL